MSARTGEALIERLLRSGRPAPVDGPLTLTTAQGLTAYAEAKAREMGIPVVVSVANAEGRQILFHRMEGKFAHQCGDCHR
ncbi:heme-binding protein [Breoghania sp.]|uniref:heme-binding protein n=1 Tax=Breoghania sp. TaxID=2065378 RepID=UPI00262B87B2|nr:heme-binding protein [Breoghania sp.]MDJ0932690.1 heme-binding protein [Breoghania sp.]